MYIITASSRNGWRTAGIAPSVITFLPFFSTIFAFFDIPGRDAGSKEVVGMSTVVRFQLALL